MKLRYISGQLDRHSLWNGERRRAVMKQEVSSNVIHWEIRLTMENNG